MTLNEFMAEFRHYMSEYEVAHGQKPTSINEFEQYLLNRKNRLIKPRNAKSINWLFSGKKH